MVMRLSEKHFSITSTQDVEQIIQPIKKLGINFFSYLRIYPEGTFTVLINQAKWHKHFSGLELPGSLSFSDLKTGIYLWQDISHPQVVTDARNYFNIDNLIDFVYSDKNYIESFSFGTPKTQQAMLSFYFNNLDILQRFIDYFKTQSFDLFKQADKERLLFPTHMTTNTNFNAPDFSENQRIDLLMSIRAIKKHHHLTEKELCCLKHLAYGKSIKEIASILNNSPRTIETHLSNIKAKIGCFSKSQMLDVYFKQYSSIMDTAL
jgi:LuxR family transcriptional regulator, quorum-sensing system regulator SolR